MVVLVWIILGVGIKPGLCYDIPESLYGRTGIPYREHRTAVYRYIGISLHPYFHMLCITWLHICMQKLLLVLRGERYSIKMFPNYYIFHTKIDCFNPKFRSCGAKHGKQIVLSNSALFKEVNLCIRTQMTGFLFFQKP